MKTKIILTKDDYKYIDEFQSKFRLIEGRGYNIMFQIFLNEYKLKYINGNKNAKH